MKIDDLKSDWQRKIQATEAPSNLKETFTMLSQKIEKMDAQIKRRDQLEIGVAYALIPVWVIGLFSSESAVQSAGFVIAIISCLYIPYKMRKAKQVPAVFSTDKRAFLSKERQKVMQQKEMLESIFWWYLGPLGLSISLISIGGNVDQSGIPILTMFSMIYLLAVVVLYTGIYFLNKRAAKEKFAPMLETIEEQLAQLDQQQ